jgi:hypothetical protein
METAFVVAVPATALTDAYYVMADTARVINESLPAIIGMIDSFIRIKNANDAHLLLKQQQPVEELQWVTCVLARLSILLAVVIVIYFIGRYALFLRVYFAKVRQFLGVWWNTRHRRLAQQRNVGRSAAINVCVPLPPELRSMIVAYGTGVVAPLKVTPYDIMSMYAGFDEDDLPAWLPTPYPPEFARMLPLVCDYADTALA